MYIVKYKDKTIGKFKTLKEVDRYISNCKYFSNISIEKESDKQ